MVSCSIKIWGGESGLRDGGGMYRWGLSNDATLLQPIDIQKSWEMYQSIQPS